MSWDNSRADNYDNLLWVNDATDLSVVLRGVDPKPGDYALDAGCGTGAVGAALSPYVKHVDMLDSSEEMLEKCRERCIGDKFTIEAANIVHGLDVLAYDIAVMRMVLHHVVTDEVVAMASVASSLSAGGRLCVVEGVPPRGCLGWFTEMFKVKEARNCYTPDTLVGLVDEQCRVKRVDVVVQQGMSLNNWLRNSEKEQAKRDSIWWLHQGAPQYVKDAYNMRFVDGDIIMDWQTCIVVGVKE